MNATAQAEKIEPPAVRREGRSLFVGETQVAASRRLFSNLDPSDLRVGASLRTYFHRDFNAQLVSTGIVNCIEVLQDCNARSLLEALQAQGEAVFSPDVIDAAVRIDGAYIALDGVYAFVDCNPGPDVVSITFTGEIPDVKWYDQGLDMIPEGSVFLVFGRI